MSENFLERRQQAHEAWLNWRRGLKAGDEVVVCEHGREVWRGVVVRITPTGRFVVKHHLSAEGDVRHFGADGYMRDAVYYYRRLEQPT